MSFRILTNSVTSIDNFVHDPRGILNNAEDGIIAVFIDNTPAFYALTSKRLARLLEIETCFSRPVSNTALSAQLFKESTSPAFIPMGKFAMYSGWKPDVDFQRQAALWGIALTQPVTPEELASFIAWWQTESKVFSHIQWQQKLARSLQICRANSSSQPKRDINAISQPDTQIPQGFRGAK